MLSCRRRGFALLPAVLPTMLVATLMGQAAPLGAQAAKPAVPVVNPAIIPLPLQPVVPASQRTCATKTASGLGYSELRAGPGPKAGPTDYVLLNYVGYLAANGQVFDQNMATPLTVDGVIPGFSEGLSLIPRGAIWRFCIPAALGYGKAGTGPIPGDADLVFQVELLDSRTKAEVEAMRQAAAEPPAGAPATASAGTQPSTK